MRGQTRGSQQGIDVEASATSQVIDAQPAALRAGTVRWPLLLLVFAAALVPLLLTPVLPLIDFYNHIARIQVLAGLDANPLFAANYAAAWAILPNIGLDVIAVAALQVVPLAALPHLVAALIAAVMFFGILALNRAVTGQTAWPAVLLAIPLLYSWIFNWGFVNFLLGLGLALLAAAWWVQQRRRPLLRLAVAMLLGLAVFFCHALAFGLYGILIAALEAGHWWQQPRRRLGDLAAGMGLCAVQAVLPAILFMQSRTAAAAGGISNADESLVRLRAHGLLFDRLIELAALRVQTIVRVAEGPTYLADALWMAALVGVIGWAAARGALRLAPMVVPAVLAGMVLVAVMPPALFGSGYVADRMPLFLAAVLAAGVMPGPAWGRTRALVPALAALAGLRLVMVALQWQGTAGDLADFDLVASRLPPGQMMAGLSVSARPHEDMPNRCEMYPPLLLVRHGHAVPLFAIRAAQPLELRGRLAAARDELAARPAGPLSRGRPELVVSAFARAGYDYLLLCQTAADRPLPATPYPIVAQAGRFRLLRLPGER